jgi:hypothetical protein
MVKQEHICLPSIPGSQNRLDVDKAFDEICTFTYLLLILFLKMRSVTTIRKILERLGFSASAETYFTGTCGINSLHEIAYLDGIDDVDTTIKGVTNPGGMVTTGMGSSAVTLPVAKSINLILVRSYHYQQRHEVGFKKTAEEPVINDKDWPRTLEKVNEYLASQYRGTGATLEYVVRPDIEVKPESEDPVEGYETVDQEMTARAHRMGRYFVNDRHKGEIPFFKVLKSDFFRIVRMINPAFNSFRI